MTNKMMRETGGIRWRFGMMVVIVLLGFLAAQVSSQVMGSRSAPEPSSLSLMDLTSPSPSVLPAGPAELQWKRVTAPPVVTAKPRPRPHVHASRSRTLPSPTVGGEGAAEGAETTEMPAVMWRIRRCESGGDYRAANPRSTASGAWQFLDSTWRGVTGLPGRARDYSPAVQDRAALKLYRSSGTRPWNASKGCWG